MRLQGDKPLAFLFAALVVAGCSSPEIPRHLSLDGTWIWLLTEGPEAADTTFSSGFEHLILRSDGSFRMIDGSRTPPITGTYTTLQEDAPDGGAATLVRFSQSLPLFGPTSVYLVDTSEGALRLTARDQQSIIHLFVRDRSDLVCSDPANQDRCLEWLRR